MQNFKGKSQAYKKFKQCKKEYMPFSTLQKVCSVSCSLEYVRKEREREFNLETKKLKERIKTKREWVKEVQVAFNAYIRERDAGHPCISCGRHHNGQYHAGHYKSVGAHPELRFNEDNCSLQCSACNNYLSGNIVNYRPNLIAKIGIERLEKLESYNEPKEYTIDDLKKLKQLYKDKLKTLKARAQ